MEKNLYRFKLGLYSNNLNLNFKPALTVDRKTSHRLQTLCYEVFDCKGHLYMIGLLKFLKRFKYFVSL